MKTVLLLTGIFISSFNAFAQDINYKDSHTIACHNCFDPQYANNIEEVFPYTTTIELDIWDTKTWFGIGGWKALNNDWYVRHVATDKVNKNCCGGTLKDCLMRVSNWSKQHPDHSIITIIIDKKENWSNNNESRLPKNLDALILSCFDESKILTPSVLRGKKANLRDALTSNGWPTLESLKGKVMLVLTDGTVITGRQPLDEYLQSSGERALCFVAPEIASEPEISSPKGFSRASVNSIVFFNLSNENKSLATQINSAGFISRIYGIPENINSVNELIKLKVNFIALYNYKIKL
ncbi:Ca2+-dependent phosphoinositide-specific phospholipase C [Hymenobacter tibetensis]|uniref:Ca2+-dependent phosphoinositide-specific phospholipase C n=1 Tax=Hymenobacter tibetensis TaxID=497967 RepID=A0ABY4CTT1_9BACT|nr:Ca2+-dependent phosphoinositide-specific phospholipase C [Hymenobacter tibetensis]UOG73457.1 Ca2+-dependent phosphoinositide-specific phospholipase C [Hymenobacter tibetensis]